MSSITWDAPVLPVPARRTAPAQRRGTAPAAAGRAASPSTPRVRRDAGAGPSHLRLTARGRAVVIAAGVVLAFGGALTAGSAVADAPAAAVPVAARTVQSGETLWGIASALAAPGQDVREVVDLLADLNGLSGGSLQAGQQILVPAA